MSFVFLFRGLDRGLGDWRDSHCVSDRYINTKPGGNVWVTIIARVKQVNKKTGEQELCFTVYMFMFNK